MAISIDSNGRITAHWIQNGIKNKKVFKVLKEAERYLEIVDEVRDSIKLAEEFRKFSQDFSYDPDIVKLKIDSLEKEINDLKERIRVKQSLQRKFEVAAHKLVKQPRNVIGREEFWVSIKEIKDEIGNLDRFFKEHTIVGLQRSLNGSIDEMKGYYQSQKECIKQTEALFKDLYKNVIEKLGSVTTKDKVLDINEVIKYLGISRASVTKMMLLEGLPYFKVGNRYRIKENDLKRWINNRNKESKFI